MNLNQELQTLNNRLDRLNQKLSAAVQRNDTVIAEEARKEIAHQEKKIKSVKSKRERDVYQKGKQLNQMKFHRSLTKQEQADLGKLKKSVKGLVVVHPLAALGRELGLKEVTGFADKSF